MNIKCTPVFQRNLEATKKIVINRGGTRSSKTVSICQMIAKWLATGHLRNDYELESGVCRIVRKYQATLKNSVQVDFEDVLTSMELWEYIEHNKTDRTYTFVDGKNKRTVVMSGADDQQKLRGVKQDILYCNEANELTYNQEFFQLLMRTSGLVIIDFNPDDEDIWINTELEKVRAKEKGDVEVIVSTYKDNPLLPKQMVEEIELLERTDPMYWQIYGLGEYGKIQGLVFPEYLTAQGVPVDAKFLGYGQDFGYTNDPSTLIGGWTQDYEGKRRLYLQEFLYETGLTNTHIADRYDSLGIDKTDTIIADSAEQKSIQELCDRGYNVKPAKKGRDSIIYGIELIKQFDEIIIVQSPNLEKEFKHYKWQENKDGISINKPIDKFNHGIDAVRYLLMSEIEHKAPVSLAKKRNHAALLRQQLLSSGARNL